jgi:hypothetical protein
MGIRVDYVDGLDVSGQYIHDERRVEVKVGLPPDFERSVLAHEAQHAELRHEPQEIWCRTQRQERLASAMAGRNLIDFHQMATLQRSGMTEKEMCAELHVARVILRAYLWMSAPAWQVAKKAAAFSLPLLGVDGFIHCLDW